MSDGNTMGQVIQIDEARIRDHLGEKVHGTVEETLNAMLYAKADHCAVPAVASAAELGRHPGWQLDGTPEAAPASKPQGPKLRRQTFETAIIERYRRQEN